MAMLITTDQLARFSGVYPETDDLQTIYINSATQKINDYVGFDVMANQDWEQEVTTEHIVYSENGENFFEDPELTVPAEIPEGAAVTQVVDTKYHYFTTSTEVVPPDIFKLVCLEIASLIQCEESSNLGVNTRDEIGVNRTFLNVVDYSKYLDRLSSFRITKV